MKNIIYNGFLENTMRDGFSECEPFKHMYFSVQLVAAQWNDIIDRSQGTAKEKTSNIDFVTSADREIEEIVRDNLNTLDEDATVVGEENGETQGESGRKYYIDPIDGTFNFVRNSADFCVAIACEEDNDITAAVCYFPALEMTVQSVKGEGVQFSGMPLHSGERRTPGTVSTQSKLDGAALNIDVIDGINRDVLGPLCTELYQQSIIKQQMCVVLSMAEVANGALDGGVLHGVNPWDVAPGYLFINEAGGAVSTMTGNTEWEHVKDGWNVVFSNGEIHDQLCELMTEFSEEK